MTDDNHVFTEHSSGVSINISVLQSPWEVTAANRLKGYETDLKKDRKVCRAPAQFKKCPILGRHVIRADVL